MNRFLRGLILNFILGAASLHAVTAPPHPPVKDNGSWLGVMEASLMTARIPSSQDWLGPKGAEPNSSWLSWMGWIVAAGFLALLLALHLRIRRNQKTLFRGGEPDFFFLPPERNRRKRPR